MKWVASLQFKNSIYQETLQEYLVLYYDLCEKIATYDICLHSKSSIAKTAVARKLACFLWGMMTDYIAALH